MSIVEKLKLYNYEIKGIINCPVDEEKEFEAIQPFDTIIGKKKYDLLFTFVYTLDEMEIMVKDIVENDRLHENGYLFLAYPKKGNTRFSTHVERDVILPAFKAEETGYVYNSNIKFSRMVSLNNTFTVVGLKYEKVKKRTTTAASQIAADYEVKVPELLTWLIDVNSPHQSFFENLSPGYKRSWARYIYSAKTDTTKEKRFDEMQDILGEGFKSKELYKKGQSE